MFKEIYRRICIKVHNMPMHTIIAELVRSHGFEYDIKAAKRPDQWFNLTFLPIHINLNLD